MDFILYLYGFLLRDIFYIYRILYRIFNFKMAHNLNNEGYKIEKFVKKYFESFNLSVTNKGFHYDLYVENLKNNKIKKIEVKSTNLLIKNGNNKISYGRFFFEIQNYKNQLKDNVDICFVVKIENKYEIIGFQNIHSLMKKFKAKKYLPLKDVMNFRVTRKEKYIENVLR